MPTSSPHRLARGLTATCLLALLTAIAVVMPDGGHPPERTVTTAPTAVEYSGPTTDPGSELDAAVEQAQLAAVFEWAAAQPPSTTTPPTELPPDRAVTTPAPAPSTEPLAAIAAHFPDLYDQAAAVARCESSLDPSAISGPNYGLFQINSVHRARVEAMGYSWGQILDPNVNAAVARAIHDEQGWAPWACRWAA